MRQMIKYVFVSGMGFLFDFAVYNLLIYYFNLNVDVSNIISSLLGLSLVFFLATKKVFETNTKKIKLTYKYFLYVIYELLLIFLASKLMLSLNNVLSNSSIIFINHYASIIAKICITPWTLLINYFVMKKLTKW